MDGKRKAPAVRFSGFTGDWEQRKFGESFKLSQGLQVPVEEQMMIQELNTEQFIRIVDVTQKGELPRYVYNPTGKGRVTEDDLFFVRYGAVGTVGYGYNGVIANNLFKVEPLYSAYNSFLYQLFSGTTFNNKLKNMSASTSMPAVNFGALNKLTYYSTSYEEQKKIGDYFTNLDNFITLHQRKYDALVNTKKSMLQKMFPQNGETVPEIRFAGFTGDWEQRKLGDVFEEYSEKNHEELPALMIVQGGGTMRRDESDRNLMYDKSNLSNYKLVNEGDFIVHLRSFEGGLEMATNTGIISPAYHTLHGENTDSVFYYSYFRSKKFVDSDLKPHVYGIRDGRSIDIEGMKTIKIPYTNFDEQKAIGDFISKLDNIITLHQRELEKLQNIKKACLEKMFV